MSTGMARRMRVWWIAAGLLWIVSSVGAALARAGDRSTAFVVGGIAGRLLGSLLIAMVLRWAYVKMRGSDRPVWHPWTLVLAAVVSLLTLGARTADARACQDEKTIEAASLLSSPPEGYRVEKKSEEDAREILTDFGDEEEKEIRTASLALATRSDDVVAVYVLTSASRRLDRGPELEDFRSSFEDESEDIDIGGEDGLVHSDGDSVVAFGTSDCGAIVLVGVEEKPVRDVAKSLKLPGRAD